MRFAKFFTAIAVVAMSISTSFANDTVGVPSPNDIEAATNGAMDHLKNDSFAQEMIPEGSVITLSEGLPCVFSNNFPSEMSFDSIKQAPDGYYFSFYVDGAPGGYLLSQILDGSFKAVHVAYSETEYAQALKSLEYDDVVLVNDWRDEYYLIRKDGEEYIVPGLMRNHQTTPTIMSTKYGLDELVNAIEYRDTYFPLDPKIVGGSDSDTAWEYIGIIEANNAKRIAIIATCVIGGVTVIGFIFFVVRKRRKMVLQ